MKALFLENTTSTHVNAIMAQPMQEQATTFNIASYGSINKFTFTDVLRRWDFIKEQCALYGITVDGYSEDGDSKILRAMKMFQNFIKKKDILKLHISKMFSNLFKR